jgi:hypothetical protein
VINYPKVLGAPDGRAAQDGNAMQLIFDAFLVGAGSGDAATHLVSCLPKSFDDVWDKAVKKGLLTIGQSTPDQIKARAQAKGVCKK